ncbi:MAG TPA: ATP-binding protein [Candidatus Limnocylindria bacterium]
MDQAEPATSRLARDGSSKATRAASIGLAGVVVCLAAFSIFAAYTTQSQVIRAQDLDARQEGFDRAVTAVSALQIAELEYHLQATAQSRAELSQATEAMIVLVQDAAALGDDDDRQLAKEITVLHSQFRASTARLVAAIVVHDTVEAVRIDEVEFQPMLETMRVLLKGAADKRVTEVHSDFATLRSTAQLVLVLSPLVFAIGFALMLALWRIRAQSDRATRKVYAEIEQLSKLRSEFVSIVSHEFRTPLTGIQGFSEMMRDEELTPAETREYAGDINKDARRLARLITDMLDLDRMESGRMTLNSEPVDLNRIVTDTAAQFRLSAANHPIELDLDRELPLLMGDADRLTQVVSNLLSNAIKYSPSGGSVELTTERANKTVTFTVRDHGIGIPAGQLERIFDRYSRIETTETRAIQGTGLGLPIVRQIVQLSEGKVWATSEVGQGSVLHVQLPLPEAAALAPIAA